MMPNIVRLMQEALNRMLDVSLDEEAREAALLELQEHVEDIDRARDFKTIGGFAAVTDLLALDDAPSLQAGAAYVLGSAVKNHRELQLHLLEETGALAALLALLRAHGANVDARAK